MKIGVVLLAALAIAACQKDDIEARGLSLKAQDVKSGYEFLTSETQAQQNDPFENPGYLWVDRGAQLFSEAPGDARACAACHASGLKGVAADYPNLDADSGQLINLEGRINLCRRDHQGMTPLRYESDDLLALTAYIAEQSKGMARTLPLTDALEQHRKKGEAYFFTPRGQFNLSCHQCHDLNWSAKLRGDTISQGHLNGFPAYRLEWQSLGSSHRRLRDCDMGVRAEPLPFGHETYIELELYLAERGRGLNFESPAVRR